MKGAKPKSSKLELLVTPDHVIKRGLGTTSEVVVPAKTSDY